MVERSCPYVKYDLQGNGLLPARWEEQVRAMAERGRLVHLDGENPDSMEPEGSQGMDYYVVTGDIACSGLPWLLDLYHQPLRALAAEAFGAALDPAHEIKHGVNINVLKGAKARYEWHVDPNPVSGILYATTHGPNDGGSLVLRDGNQEWKVQPRSGHYVVFEGGRIPHAVAPLTRKQTRISIPMLFYRAHQRQVWPSGLEAYLYGR